MGLRTYIPMLWAIVRSICVYTGRYDAQIRHHLDTPLKIAAYDALRAACDTFVAEVPKPPKGS